MSEPEPVLDASAFLAYLQAETGADRVRAALARGCVISAVNWAEVLSKVAELGKAAGELEAELRTRKLLGTALHVVAFDEADAPRVGDLRPLTRAKGLSLGDRACLALAARTRATVLTTDRAWADLDPQVGVEVQVIR